MIMDYTLGLMLGFAHGLLAAYIIVVVSKKRHDKTVDIYLDEFDVDNKRPVFLRDLPDDLF
jgi:hypothetical protein